MRQTTQMTLEMQIVRHQHQVLRGEICNKFKPLGLMNEALKDDISPYS